PPANREIHRAVFWIDDDIAERKRFCRNKFLDLRPIGGAIGRQMHRIHRPERPVAREQRRLVFWRKFRSCAKRDASWAARSDVESDGEAVWVIGWPYAGS